MRTHRPSFPWFASLVALGTTTAACLVSFDLPPDQETCGNDHIDPGELCDLTDLGGKTCASEGYYQGQLRCAPDCLSLDVSGCDGICGDGLVQGQEECDGSNLDDATCERLGFAPGGTLSCQACLLDTSGCCGDGSAVGNEACDDGNAVDWDGCTGCQISEIQANPDPTGGQGQPDIAVSPQGDTIAVVWAPLVGNTPNGARLRIFDGQGLPLTGEITVSASPSLEHAYPNVGVGPQSTVWVAFHCDNDRDGSGWGIYLQAFDREGARLLTEDLQVNTTTLGNQQYPRISVNRAGEAVVVWDQWNAANGQHEVMFQRFGADLRPQGQERLVYGQGDHDPTMPVAALEDDGGVLVAWKTDGRIYASWGSPTDVFSQPARLDGQAGHLGFGAVTLPTVALTEATGGLSGGVVAWQHKNQADPANPIYSVQAQVIQSGGVLVPNAFYEFPGTATAGMKNPAVVSSGDVLNSDGRVWLLWTGTEPSAPQDHVQRVDPLTGHGSDPLPLSMTTQHGQGRPRAAALPSGGFVAVWRAADQDGDDTGVFFQRFSPGGDPLGVQPATP